MTRFLILSLLVFLMACKGGSDGAESGGDSTPDGGSESGGDSSSPLSWDLNYDLSEGTHNQTEESSGKIQLDAAGEAAGSGTYTAGIVDADVSGTWSEFKVTQDTPAGRNLANNRVNESAFTNGNIDMSSNVLLLHFDEASLTGAANEIVDSSGLSHHGTRTGATLISTTGHLGSGIDIDGAGDHVQVADSNDLDFTTNLTMAGWFFFDTDIGSKRLIVKGSQDDSNWSYRIVTLDNGAFGFQDGLLVQLSADGVAASLQTFVNNGLASHKDKWVHISATYDGSDLRLFINGSEVASTSGSVTLFNSPAALGIGAALDGDFAVDGKIDEVALFSSPLAEADLLNMYKRGAHRLRFQAKACVSTNCSDASFIGSDGGTSTFFETDVTSASATNTFDLSSLSQSGRHFQVEATFATDAGTGTPQIEAISAKGAE